MTPGTFQQGITNKISDQATAETGTDNTKLITPLRMQNKFDYLRASTSEATIGANTIKYMCPSTTKDSIKDSFSPSQTSRSFGTNYLAPSSGFVVGYAYTTVSGTLYLT